MASPTPLPAGSGTFSVEIPYSSIHTLFWNATRGHSFPVPDTRPCPIRNASSADDTRIRPSPPDRLSPPRIPHPLFREMQDPRALDHPQRRRRSHPPPWARSREAARAHGRRRPTPGPVVDNLRVPCDGVQVTVNREGERGSGYEGVGSGFGGVFGRSEHLGVGQSDCGQGCAGRRRCYDRGT